MMVKKKLLETKVQAIALKERQRRVVTAIFLIFILSMFILSAYFACIILNPLFSESFVKPALQFKPENPNSKLKAALVDEVSLTMPDPTFVQTAAKILVQANYSVDYYSGGEVTVGLFRNLPSHGYSLVILRVHATTIALLTRTLAPKPKIQDNQLQTPQWSSIPRSSFQCTVGTLLFTSEQYSPTKYVFEQLEDQIFQVQVEGEPQPYFAVSLNFVRSDMNGTFQNTSIIMMGCGGPGNTQTAEAFIQKGAKTYISWDGTVSVDHTDQATISLLQNLITKKETIELAIANTMKEVGPDPAYNNSLEYYPLEVGDQTI
jgi:hypothetical protein